MAFSMTGCGSRTGRRWSSAPAPWWDSCRSSRPSGSMRRCGGAAHFSRASPVVPWTTLLRAAPSRSYSHTASPDRLIGLVDKPRFKRLFARMLDEQEFLSPFGLRSLSRFHLEHPLVLDLDGAQVRLDYEPAESTTPQFGGNSNWRGPVWFPFNFLAIQSLRALHRGLGRRFYRRTADWLWPEREPRRGGGRDRAAAIAALPARRAAASTRAWREPALASPTPDGETAPCFYEYFNGDTGEGLGATPDGLDGGFARRSLPIAAPDQMADRLSRSPPGCRASPRTGTRSVVRSHRSSSRAGSPSRRRRKCRKRYGPGA